MKYTEITLCLLLNCTLLFAQNVQDETIKKTVVCDSVQRIEMGYYSQNSNAVTGSVATVSGSELDKTPTSTLSLTLAGRLPGLMTFENSSQLTKEDVFLQIRGLHTNNGAGVPLVLIDGLVATSNIFETITPSEINSISILKDASTQAIYGIQGANGVIIITTKRGEIGKLKILVSMENALQQVTTKPTFINSWDYATMRNQAAKNDGIQQPFTPEQIANFKSGTDKEKYPNTNWYEMFMNDIVMQQRVGISASGGNERMRFFTNVNMVNQGSQFISDNTRYDASDASQIYNFRANVDLNLFDDLSAFFRTNGSVRRERTPSNTDISALYRSLFFMPSTTYGPCTPNGEVIATSSFNDPTYGLLNKAGFAQTTSTNTISQFGLNLDLSSITKGLKMSGYAAFETLGTGYLRASQSYERWVGTENPDDFSFIKKGDEINSSLAYSKTSSFQYQLIFNALANYERTFGKHQVEAILFGTYHNFSSPNYSLPYLYPYKRIISGSMLSYNFDNRYFAKVDLGYSGSDQFPNDHRFFATPAISAGWIVTNESFFNWKNLISYLKIRGSYGYTANDDFGANRYSYLDEVAYLNGGPISNLQNLIEERGYGNVDVAPEMIKKQNLGVDLEIANSLMVHFDYFKEDIDNMYINATTAIPGFQGIPLDNYPYTNAGKMENKGFELALNYSKEIKKDFNISVGGMMSVAKNAVKYIGEVQLDEDYKYRYRTESYSYGQGWGYLVDKSNGNGFFNSTEEIAASNLTYDFGTPRVGDLKYKDLNGDDVIDIKDKAPLGNGSVPAFYYGINASVTYRGIDFTMLFQGIGKYEVLEGGYGVDETLLDGVYSEIHKDAWTNERYANKESISYPALSVNTSTNIQSSDFYLNNKSYIRLKNVEIGYNLPKEWFTLSGIEKFRLFASGQNLFTIHNMKFKDFGPEGSYASIPVYKIYNIGIQINF